jgi:intracellular multiplication protein IcmF
MDNSLNTLCDAIKKILVKLKPQVNPLSFIILTGANEQGKSSLLKQSTLIEIPLFGEEHAKLYFNQNGIIIELGEKWCLNSKPILQNTLKQLNRCSPYLKITGFILCIDVNELIATDPTLWAQKKNVHLSVLTRMGMNLGYPIELALVFTQLDTIAGFTEFYQTGNTTDLSKPLGFSLNCPNHHNKKINTYKIQFNQFIETLGQQVINKIHPVRSTIKRTLIREFPLQLASLRSVIQTIIHSIPAQFFNIHAVYFTSAEQGGVSFDQLNKKIQHEYALVVQDTFLQATNYRSYFVEGTIKTIQEHCSQAPIGGAYTQKSLMALAVGIAACCVIFLGFIHFKVSHLLDDASKELLTYDTYSNQEQTKTQALFHLSNAARTLDTISSHTVSLPKVQQLKLNLHHNAEQQLHGEFLPFLAHDIEQVINNPANTPIIRYKALKIYLMMAETQHFNADEITQWFKTHWLLQKLPNLNHQLYLLGRMLKQPLNSMHIKQQVISDARNYLNALPSTYLYYSLAKEYFPSTREKISIEGFNLSSSELPIYYTKPGFDNTIQALDNISSTLQKEQWVLARQDMPQLKDLLVQAYCFDYITWWQVFIKKSQPLHYQDYQHGRALTKILDYSHSFSRMLALVQQATKPDLNHPESFFNQYIASKFTELNLLSLSSAKELNLRITELGQFIATISVINDQGKTAFTLTRTRFMNDNPSDPISLLYAQSKQLPEPLSTWSKQIASDSWVMLIRDSRQYINLQWQETVYNTFQNTIAHRYPFDSSQKEEISIADFNRFFSTHGVLNTFSEEYIKPFLDRSSAEWKPKVLNDFVLPLSVDAVDQIIRANIITNMFFPEYAEQSKIEFSLQKMNLDPVVATLRLQIGKTLLNDNQDSESVTRFSWPESNATLALESIDGNHYELAEQGIWALFKLLEKVNVLVDEQDSSMLQILFEINSNSGRYLLKTTNQINPFTPGILNGFTLNKDLV